MAAAAQLRSAGAAAALGTRRGRGCRLGEGKRRRGSAGRGDWTRRSWRGESGVEIQRRAQEETRREVERDRAGRRRGRRGPSGSGLASHSCSRPHQSHVTDSCSIALTRSLKAGKEAGEGGKAERSGARGGGRGRARSRQRGRELPQAPHQELAHPLGSGCGGALASSGWERRHAVTPFCTCKAGHRERGRGRQ